MTLNIASCIAGNSFSTSFSPLSLSQMSASNFASPVPRDKVLPWISRSLVKSFLPSIAWFSANAVILALKETLLQAIEQNLKLVIFIAVAAMLLMTYLATSLHSMLAMRNSKQHRKEPPIFPYWIPFVGSLISWLWDGSRLVTKMVDKFGQSVPIGLRLGPVKLYIAGDPDHVKILFKPTPASLRPMGPELAMKTIFGTPDIILPLYSDDSGPLVRPIAGSRVLPENRMSYHHTKAAHDFLTGTNAMRLGEHYMEILSRIISDDTSIGVEWVELSDLRLFIENLVFPASTETFCGSSILSLNPTLTEDFWAFDRNMPTLLKGAPRWLYPGAYKSRDKMLKMIKKWHAFAKNYSDFSKTGLNDPEWDPYFGSKYIKARQNFLHKIEVMNADGRASEDLGFLLAVSSNSVRAVYWTIFEVFARPDLLSHVRDIAQRAHDTRTEEPESVKLGTNPFLQSVFAEVTRLRVVGMLPRLVTGDDFQLGEWSIPKGSFLGIPSQTGAMNRKIWNIGTEDDPHPLDKFWEERFLIYPDKPNSGPLRKQGSAFVSSGKRLRTCSSASAQSSSEPTFSLEGLKGSYLPFGGGVKICPGRQFARQEVLCTLAKLVLKYDVEFQIPHNWEPKMDYNYFPTGTLPPAEKVPFRIRRRVS